MSNKKTISIDVTKWGYFVMWEEGGELSSGGSATIITGCEGELCQPLFLSKRGHLAYGQHALFYVYDGFYVINVKTARGEKVSAEIWRIISTSVIKINVDKCSAYADLELENSFSKGEWEYPLIDKLIPAVETAFHKASVFNCESPFFFTSKDKLSSSETSVCETTGQGKINMNPGVNIWSRRKGLFNLGDGWVIGRDGLDRANTDWFNPVSLLSLEEGYKIWDQIFEGEVVFRWSKFFIATPNSFEVVYMPNGELTEAQMVRICEIQDEIESDWKKTC